MYLSRTRLFVLFGGGILALLTIALVVLGGIEAVGEVWAAVLLVTIFATVLIVVIRQRGRLFEGYWALRLVSIGLKLYSFLALVVFAIQLIQFLRIRSIGAASIEGAIAAEVLVPLSFLTDFMIRSVVVIIAAYAGAQMIDLFTSIELSLRMMSTRRRQTQRVEVSEE